MPLIRCRTLGPVVVTLQGGDPPAELSWRKNLALLVYLARSPQRGRTREHLMGLLWGDKNEQAARHSLREAIRVLRRVLGEEGLVTEHDQVRLAPDAVRLDVEDLEERERLADWEGATMLIGGEFFEGFSIPDTSAFEDWLAAERHAWRRRGVDVLARRGGDLLERGQLREARDVALRAIQLDGCAEAAARVLITALSLLGDRAGALDAYQRTVAALDEVGRPPEPETEHLHERVRSGRRWSLGAGVPVEPDRGAEVRRAPLAGRSEALQQLLGAWHRARDGMAAVAIVEADAGLGKTRLAEEVAARARLDGAVVAAVRAVEADRTTAWSTSLALGRTELLEASGATGASPASLAAFAAHDPTLADRFRVSAEPAPMLAALRDVIHAVAAEQPVLIVADDAQWSDAESLGALSALLRDLERVPLCVMFTVLSHQSPSLLEDLRARIGRDVHGAAVHLEPLGDDAMRTLAHWAMPDYEDRQVERLARRIREDSGGRPLLAVELLHAVALGFELGAIADPWPASNQTLDQTLPGDLPDALVAAIRVGFRGLSADAQRVLATAAVLGDRIGPDALQRVTELDRDALHAALDELEWQRWLVADPRGYSFLARIVRDVIARDMVTAGQRRRIEEIARRS